MHRDNFEMAQREFAALSGDLEQILDRELPALMKRLDAADVPWTPGRTPGTR
jgi:hypothetical protein